MTPEITAERPMSELSRIAGVFVSPSKTFADVAKRPRWYIPVILLTILAVAMTVCISQRIGFERIVRQSIEQSSRAQSMTPEQINQAVAMGSKIGAGFGYAAALVGVTISVLVISAVLMLIANGMLGAQIRFAQMMGITAYASLVGLITIPLTIAVMFLKNPDDYDMRNPLAFNPGAFLNPETSSKWLIALASSFDLFTFWTMFLLAIGIHAAAPKVETTKAFFAILLPWMLWVLIKTGWVGLFG
jgi:hypothetical protein